MDYDRGILDALQNCTQNYYEPVNCRSELFVRLDAPQSQLIQQVHPVRQKETVQPLRSKTHQPLIKLPRFAFVSLFAHPHDFEGKVPKNILDDHDSQTINVCFFTIGIAIDLFRWSIGHSVASVELWQSFASAFIGNFLRLSKINELWEEVSPFFIAHVL